MEPAAHSLDDLPPRLPAAEPIAAPQPQAAPLAQEASSRPRGEFFRRLYVYPMWHTSTLTSTILSIIGAGLGTWWVIAVLFHDPNIVAAHQRELILATAGYSAIFVADAILFPFTREMLYTIKDRFKTAPGSTDIAAGEPRQIVRTETRYVGASSAVTNAILVDMIIKLITAAVKLILLVAKLAAPIVIEAITFLASIPLALIAVPVCLHRGRPARLD